MVMLGLSGDAGGSWSCITSACGHHQGSHSGHQLTALLPPAPGWPGPVSLCLQHCSWWEQPSEPVNVTCVLGGNLCAQE